MEEESVTLLRGGDIRHHFIREVPGFARSSFWQKQYAIGTLEL